MPRPSARLTSFAPAAALAFGLVGACRGATEPRPERLVLEVAPDRVPCVGMVPTECLQVRERADEPWRAFHDVIEGFGHEPGFRYVLWVSRRTVANPPADGSSVAYRLVAVLSKTAP